MTGAARHRNVAGAPLEASLAPPRPIAAAGAASVAARPRRPVATVARRTNGRQPTTQGWIAIIVFGFMAGLGIIGALASVGLYVALASDLPDPAMLTQYQLPEETVIYDRTGKIELARFGNAKREVVTFDQIPPILLDATTAVEDKTFWENAGFDPVAIVSAGLSSLRGDARGASTITQQLVRARLLPPDLVQDPNRTVERKLKEIIQSIRVTEAFPGEDGQATDHHRLPQPELLRQPELRREGRGRVVLRGRPVEDRPGPGGDPGGPAEVAVELRPGPQRGRAVLGRRWPKGAECPAKQSRLVVQDDSVIVGRRNAILDLLASGRTPMSGDDVFGGRLRGGEERARGPGQPVDAALDRPAFRVGRP